MKYQSVEGALPLGFQLGGYRIERILGDGGFGIAYLATIAEGGIKCAIKEFFPRDHAHRSGDSSVRVANPSMQDDFEYMRAMFAEEGRVLSSLSHPSFVRYIDYFDAMGTSYLVMSYESGFDLLHSIKSGRVMNENDMLNFILPLLDGLGTLHAQGYIHRDIKPQNIFSGPDNHAVLIDFGAAILIDTQLSIPPDGIFSEHFAPIEQYENDGGMGPWTDVYAVAAVMYFMLTGNKPPKATDRKLQQTPIVPLAASGIEGYSSATLTAIDRALAQNPRQRVQSAAEFAQLLKKARTDKLTTFVFNTTSSTQWWSDNQGSGLLNPKRLTIALFIALLVLLLGVVLIESL